MITSTVATGDDAEDERRAAPDGSDGWRPLAGRIDPDRVAVTGHSLGGAAALQAARQDPAFAAAINLDGYPRDPSGEPYRQPVLACGTSRTARRPPTAPAG